MEEEIRAATAGGKVKVEVTVDYPEGGMYKVSLASLIERRIVPSQPSLAPNSVVINKQTFSTAILVSIPRRIPDKWTIAAILSPLQTFPETEKLAGNEGLIAHFGDLSKRPTIGKPFYFSVYDATIANKALKLVVAPQR